MKAPQVIVFDVNETLLDLEPLGASLAETLHGRGDLLPQWFSTLLHYSLVHTLTDDYRDFGQIGAAALVMVAQSQNIELDMEEAREAIVGTMTKLPAHADVVPALVELQKRGFRRVSLTNSSNAGVTAQFEFAGLTAYFERLFSVEDVRAFKPDSRPYTYVLAELDIEPSEALMVAAHPWDLAGAQAVGMQTAFVKRPGTTLYPNTDRPNAVVANLQELVDGLPHP